MAAGNGRTERKSANSPEMGMREPRPAISIPRDDSGGDRGAWAGTSGRQGFVHDFLDRAGATAALGVAAEASVDLAGFPGAVLLARDSRPNILFGQYVTGTDDHSKKTRIPTMCQILLSQVTRKCKAILNLYSF